MIRVDRIWLATEALDMRCGADRMLARIIEVFGGAQPHHAYCFANRRATRMKVLVHDGVGVWVALRRLNRGKFVWAAQGSRADVGLDREQFQALILGLGWHRVGRAGIISVI